MKKTLFIDTTCPKPYDTSTLLTEGLGGSEATMVRVTDRLHALGHSVLVEQKGRKEALGHYRPLGSTKAADVDAVVVYRNADYLVKMHDRFPGAKLYLWCQDMVDPAIGYLVPWMIDKGVEMICVSAYHQQQAITSLRLLENNTPLRVHFIYNAIEDTLVRNTPKVQYDRNKLIWLSAPIKGWDYAKNVWSKLYEECPEMSLHVYNPGYVKDVEKDIPGVVVHGSVPSKDLQEAIEGSLCLFYPNPVFPETFGLVVAECNALGTPVMVHPFGAMPEVTDHPTEMVDCRNIEKVVKRVLIWRDGERPVVAGKKIFTVSKVVKEWERVLR